MSPKVKRAIDSSIALLILAGFLLIYARAFYLAWVASGKPPDLPSALVYVGTALAGLAGAVVAMLFNEQLPDEKQDKQPPQGMTATPSASGIAAGAFAVRNVIAPRTKDYLAIVSTAYCIGYALVGFAAIITWVMVEATTPEMVKSLALISLGLFIAIARTFVSVPKA